MDELGTTPAEPTSGESFINPDGTWKEGWKEAYVPEDLRNEKFFDSPFAKDLPALIKTAANQAKALGKKGVVPLSENSTEFEVQEWRKAHGVPDQYNYQKTEALQNIDDKLVESILTDFNKANLNQKQLDVAMGKINDLMAFAVKSDEENTRKIRSESWQSILNNENTNYEVNQQLIDKAVNQFTQGWSDEDKLALFPTNEEEEKMDLGDDYYTKIKPMRRKVWAEVGKTISEHRMVAGDTGGKPIQEQLDEAMKDPNFIGGFGKPHQDAVNKVLKLRELLNAQQGKA